MLDSDHQRHLLIEHRAAIVYLPAHLTKLSLLKLVLRKWTWLESIYENDPRSFAYRVTAGGTHVPVDLVNYLPRRLRAPEQRGPAPPPEPLPSPAGWRQPRLPLS